MLLRQPFRSPSAQKARLRPARVLLRPGLKAVSVMQELESGVWIHRAGNSEECGDGPDIRAVVAKITPQIPFSFSNARPSSARLAAWTTLPLTLLLMMSTSDCLTGIRREELTPF